METYFSELDYAAQEKARVLTALRECRATFTSELGWQCDCRHKHPLLCIGAYQTPEPRLRLKPLSLRLRQRWFNFSSWARWWLLNCLITINLYVWQTWRSEHYFFRGRARPDAWVWVWVWGLLGRAMLIVTVTRPDAPEVWTHRYRRRIAQRGWNSWLAWFTPAWPTWLREYPVPDDWVLDGLPEDAADDELSNWTHDG